jgi:hypothetical protein
LPNRPGLHIVFRSHGGDNDKDRPQYYSKLLGLASLVRAADAVDPHPQILFVNDGPIPDDRLDLMRRHGEIVPIVGGSNRRSYRFSLALAAARACGPAPWPDDDVVWFAEDDYLYGVESLSQLQAAAGALARVDYLSMWGGDALDPASPRSAPRARPERLSAGDPNALPIDGVRWYRGMSTTSTFGVRVRALREDLRLLRAVPFTGGAFDRSTCLAVQGLQPFSWGEVRAEAWPSNRVPPAERPRAVLRGAALAALNLRAFRRPANRRTFAASDPEQIFHMELPTQAKGRDWPAFAEETRLWAQDRRIPVDAARTRLRG